MMRLLLDTHVLVWAVGASARLDERTAEALGDTGNLVWFSAVSIWEVAIKYRLGRSDFLEEPNQIASAAVDMGFVELPLRGAVAANVATLPLYHRDPFDRLLIAQAIAETAIFFTADEALTAYSPLVTQIGTRSR